MQTIQKISPSERYKLGVEIAGKIAEYASPRYRVNRSAGDNLATISMVETWRPEREERVDGSTVQLGEGQGKDEKSARFEEALRKKSGVEILRPLMDVEFKFFHHDNPEIRLSLKRDGSGSKRGTKLLVAAEKVRNEYSERLAALGVRMFGATAAEHDELLRRDDQASGF